MRLVFALALLLATSCTSGATYVVLPDGAVVPAETGPADTGPKTVTVNITISAGGVVEPDAAAPDASPD